ncbi:hypothetical protein K227x_03910 [Rubripirellula lacrimiformis]|uniref:TIGR03067 domain-containing protein n=1 Tax=Rubripirellula lacrimiformis TaxID=1930273 RepID=A0A517N4E8_9BACT|nr:TIGR03067 domain-containing protein [Rubripirellula lacrimiformis]QDT02020.1 hypothetical protein K227x_03910 [Rubripirellula lacrimiformis]
MRFCIATLAALTLTLPVDFASADEGEHKNAQQRLQGRWEIVGGTNQGRELSEAEVSGTYVTITTNSIVTYDRSNQARYQAVFTVDEDKDPMHITMRTVAENAPTRPKAGDPLESDEVTTAAGIFKFDGQSKWVLCYALPGADRPTKFQSPDGSRTMLFLLEKKQGDPIPVLDAEKR